MDKKATILVLILVFIMTLTITTCDFLNRDMKLILPGYLYDGSPDLSAENGVIKLYDYEELDTFIELLIVPADEDSPDNFNNDSDDLTKILKIPPNVIIPANTLYVEFNCQAIDTEMTCAEKYKDVTVRASTRSYNDAEDTVTIFDIATEPTAEPTATPEPTETPEATEPPESSPDKRFLNRSYQN